MSYQSWFDQHAKKHKELLSRLSHLNEDEIIDYFEYDNISKKEPDFCPLYKEDKKCHDMEDLNCYLCACPNFRVGDKKSFCSIDSKEGGSIEHKGYIHQDCSKCFIPHKKEYIKKHFDTNWKKIMNKTFKP